MTSSTQAFAARIIGTGSSFPAKILSNHELASSIQSSDEWIRERTGIAQRRISDPDNLAERNSSLALLAATAALEMAGKTAQDIDQIVYATCTPDTPIPSSACWLQSKLNASRAWAVDLNAACSGFVYGLSVADAFIRSGSVKTSLVVGADILSSITNWSDRSSCILFGDGAGAAVLEQVSASSQRQILACHLQSDGHLWDLFHVTAGGSNQAVTPEILENQTHKMQMKGKEIFKIAVKTLADAATLTLEKAGLSVQDVDWIIPHQANLRIIEAVAKRLQISMDKIVVNITNYGNTSSATVPTALDEAVRDQRIQPGHLVLLDVFGAGLTSGTVLFRW